MPKFYVDEKNNLFMDDMLLINSEDKERLLFIAELLSTMQNKIDKDISGAFTKSKLAEDFKAKKHHFVFVDLNHLKAVNDFQGHKKGDELIFKAVAYLKQYGNTYRVGGDEFVVLIDDASMLQKFQLQNQYSKMFSFGVAKKHEYSTFNQAYEIADKRMYQHKQAQQTKCPAFSGDKQNTL